MTWLANVRATYAYNAWRAYQRCRLVCWALGPVDVTRYQREEA